MPPRITPQAETWKQKGNDLFARGKWSAAIEAYTEARLMCPQWEVPLVNRALCYRKRGCVPHSHAPQSRRERGCKGGRVPLYMNACWSAQCLRSLTGIRWVRTASGRRLRRIAAARSCSTTTTQRCVACI
jgi:hypothetical protein